MDNEDRAMKAIILAGGYAKRLEPLTKHMPKALLPIVGKPIIDFTIEKLLQVLAVDEILISANMTFENHFRYWRRGLPQEVRNRIRIVVLPVKSEEEKLGAMGAVRYIINHEGLAGHDLLIVAGDNLFEFQLPDFVAFYGKHKSPVVALCDLKDKDRVRGKYGVAGLDGDGKLIQFAEKPVEPTSALASTCCYVMPSSVGEDIERYVQETGKPDAPGEFLRWLYPKKTVYGFVFEEKWYDIGDSDSYDKVNEDYASRIRIID